MLIICLAVCFTAIIVAILVALFWSMWSRRRTKNQLKNLRQDVELRLIPNADPHAEVAGEDADPADVDDHEDIELQPLN